MDLAIKILENTETVTRDDLLPNGSIRLQDDGDGVQYISQWNHSEPMPQALTLGKPA